VSIAQLSARALLAREAAMGQATDRTARRAGETAATQALATLGTIVARGRVEARGRVREWWGDEQSVMALRCRRFAERGGQDALQAMEGQEVVLAGTVLEVSDRLIAMSDCRLLPAATALPPLAALTEARGLEPRPLTAAEANAGPGRGIAPTDVERVLYTARFQTMPDGLGNMYTDRDECVYVLLRDGSAYRHSWSFPFSDLDLGLSRRREPGRWLRWHRDGEAVLLEDAEGRHVDLNRARQLLPLTPGTRFDHHYYLLNVGMGGFRRDRAYTFRSDGTVTLSASNLVAANLGPNGYIAATRPGSRSEVRYAFDGFVLTLTDAEGRAERRFVAQFAAPQNGVPPSDLIIGGEVHWTRDEDRRRK
ncbi:hypothetical protein, partial [Plastoroseomonas hellenica]|uniref:hypothetical protein n=1 Tax=Plastoroseomonas hellenica TaxID=2687306 RepID=UPI001BAB4ECE